jgi:hypothetical protein
MSVNDLCGDTLNSDRRMHIDKDDPDVQAAAEALGSMARGLPNGSSGRAFSLHYFQIIPLLLSFMNNCP